MRNSTFRRLQRDPAPETRKHKVTKELETILIHGIRNTLTADSSQPEERLVTFEIR